MLTYCIQYYYLSAVSRLIYSLSYLLENSQYGFQLLKNHQRRVGEALCNRGGATYTALHRKYRRGWSEVSEVGCVVEAQAYTASKEVLQGK